MRITLYDRYLEQARWRRILCDSLEQAGFRKEQVQCRTEEKLIEDYHNPALFWCDCFHIYDTSGNYVLDIWGPDMTNEQFDVYKDYYEFKTCWTGCDYTHHHYLKP